MRLLRRSRGCLFLAVLVTLGHGVSASPAQQASEQRADQAKDILRRHCAECHAQGGQTKGQLIILDYTQLVDRKEVVLPKKANLSELIELIENGTMPPGTRPKVSEEELQTLRDWINDPETPARPFDFGEEYVIRTIRDDVAKRIKQNAELARRARYFSLNHYLATKDTRREMDRQRELLTEAVTYLSLNGHVPITPVDDPVKTVYRVDIQDLGWNKRPFNIFEKGKFSGESTWTLYDALLLEYPLAGILDGFMPFKDLDRDFLGHTGQIRPTAYLRSDWFIQLAAQQRFSQDFRKLLGKSDNGTPFEAVLKPFPNSVEKLPADRIPIPLLDALANNDHVPKPAPFSLEVKTLDPQLAEQSTFTAGEDKMVVSVLASKEVFIEMIWTTPRGEKTIQELRNNKADADKPKRIGKAAKEPFTAAKEPGVYQLTILASEKEFLPGEVLRWKGVKNEESKPFAIAERVVHPFYKPWEGDKQLDPSDAARIVKKTIQFEIKPPKK